MRSDQRPLRSVLDGFESRKPTSDGRAALRVPEPFEGAEPVDIDLSVHDLESRRDLFATLTARRSMLRYSRAPVRTELVIGLLQEALARDTSTWSLDEEAGPLEGFVFALRSEGLPTGVYRVTASGCSRVAPVEVIGEPEELGVQREFGTGGGVISVFGDLDRADSWAGSHGYRICLVRAAMVAYDFHMRLQSTGLVGTIFGGFIAASVRDTAKSDGVTRQPLLSSTYAHPIGL